MDMKKITADEPMIVFDDVNKHIGYLMGLGKHVHPQSVNFMIKEGKGLLYVCITEAHAKQLGLSYLAAQHCDRTDPFSVSVDLKTSTTGISAIERANTIRAFVHPNTKAAHFRKPGHVFPLIGKNKGVYDRLDIVEAVISLADHLSGLPVAYMTEILNERGGMASLAELEEMSQRFKLDFLTVSDIYRWLLPSMPWLNIVDTKNMFVNNQWLQIYRINNTLNDDGMTVYVKKYPAHSPLRLKFYKECPWAEHVNVGKSCSCQKHFQHYFEDFLAGRFDSVVYLSDRFEKLNDVEKKATFAQLKEHIYAHYYQQAPVNMQGI